MTQEVKCYCKNDFQDREYGKGMRACTPVNKSKDLKTKQVKRVRCRACGVEHDAPEGYKP